MSSPTSRYSDDARDFLGDFKRKRSEDARLQEHQDLVQEFGENYERAYQLLNTFQAEAYKDQSFYLGNQWSLEELSYLNNQRRSSFTYNYTRRLIELVMGIQIKNQLAAVLSPIENASEETASIGSDVIQYVMQYSGGYQIENQAVRGALTSGISFMSPYLDYREDPVNGDIKFHLDEWNAVMFDPFLTKRDLSDCTFVARRKYLGRSDVISMLPDKEDIIKSLPWGSRDDKFTYMPYARQWGMQKLMNYTEYWRTKWETKEVLVDMQTGETREWDGDRKRLRLYREMFPQVEVIKKPVRCVELGIIVEGELLYYGKDPWGLNDYPFVPFFAIFEPSYDLYSWKIQSLVRLVRDPQTELNKRRSKLVDMMDKGLYNSWIAKNNSVTNPSSLYKTGAGQVIFIKPEAQISDVQQLQNPPLDPAHFQLQGEFEKDMTLLAGLSPENFGMAENEKVETAGILAKMRQSAGLIGLEGIFEGVRESQKLVGQKIWKLIQKNYSAEKIQNITKKTPTPEFFSGNFSRYNMVMQEGILTDSQKQTQFAQYLALKSLNIPIPDELIIRNSGLHDKKELEQFVAAQAQQQNQLQQQQHQLEMEKLRTLSGSLDAKAEADHALAAERGAKIGLDVAERAERLERAEEDKTASILNLVKAVKEIEGLDVENLMKKVELLKSLVEPSGSPSEAKAVGESA